MDDVTEPRPIDQPTPPMKLRPEQLVNPLSGRVTRFPVGKSAFPRSGPTPDEVRLVAKDVARQEIVAASKALADNVRQVMAQSMAPLDRKLSAINEAQNRSLFCLTALVELLVEKKIITKDELAEKVNKTAAEAMAKYRAAVEEAKKRAEVEKTQAADRLQSDTIGGDVKPEYQTPPNEISELERRHARSHVGAPDVNCPFCEAESKGDEPADAPEEK